MMRSVEAVEANINLASKDSEEKRSVSRSIQEVFDIPDTYKYFIEELNPLLSKDGINFHTIPTVLASKIFNRYPSHMVFDNYVRLKSLIKELKNIGKVSLVCANSYSDGNNPTYLVLHVSSNKFEFGEMLVFVGDTGAVDVKSYPQYSDDVIDEHGNICYTEALRFYYHPGNKAVYELINSIAKNCEINFTYNKDTYVEMIISTPNGLATQRVKFDFNYNESDLDLHYGEGFSQFHSKLIDRIKTKDKGIVMFHGPPGNGKTHYIRRLLPILSEAEKRVILIPKHILGAVESPAFNMFMLQNFVGQKIVFIMEDAESIIAKRTGDGGGRSELVSTLLNITDGILNDIFSIQVILTFNTDLKSIDDALLRKGRLLAKHTFANLSPERAELLASHLGVQISEEKSSYSLAEIYSYKEAVEDDLLINQGLEKKKKALGFGS